MRQFSLSAASAENPTESKTNANTMYKKVSRTALALVGLKTQPLSVNPNVAYLRRGKTRQSAPDVAAHRLGQVEAYLTVREALSETSTSADGVLSRERSGFCRCRCATLGLIQGNYI